ncbi:MAG: flagellar export protein FliJ [Gallionellales bacterium GWA2_59_43]|nr:MAG: flagellar export protein FliJ [Gallionellales bacterium GWA2_59_43]
MTKPFSLATLMNLVEHSNESATRKLGLLNQQQQSAQQKLDTLLEFRRDYQSQMQKGTQEGMSPIELRNFQQFIYKLDDAIAQQRKQLEKSQASTQLGRNEFDVTQRKLKSLDTLRQRHIETQRKIAEKAEQKAQDEHSGRAAARRMSDHEEQDNQPKNEH